MVDYHVSDEDVLVSYRGSHILGCLVDRFNFNVSDTRQEDGGWTKTAIL